MEQTLQLHTGLKILDQKQPKDIVHLSLAFTVVLSAATCMVTSEPRERPNIPTLSGIT